MPLRLSRFLDLCRWLGALVVLFFHGGNFFINIADVMSAPHAAPVYVWWLLVNGEIAHQAVVGFFALSGYLIGGAVLEAARGGRCFLADYLIHRLARVYIVLVPALLATLLLDGCGRLLFGTQGIYGLPMFEGHFAPALIVANLLNLQYIVFDYFGTNGPLWSLACEFWFYVTFPLLALPLCRAYGYLTRAVGFTIGMCLLVLLTTHDSWFLTGYAIWFMGALARLFGAPPIRSPLAAGALFAATLTLVRFFVRGAFAAEHPAIHMIADASTAAAFLALLVSLRHGRALGGRLIESRLNERLAGFSFSLYCLHLPILVFLRAAAERIFGLAWPQQLATPAHWLVAGFAFGATLALAYGFSRLTEAKTALLRAALRRGLDRAATMAEFPRLLGARLVKGTVGTIFMTRGGV